MEDGIPKDRKLILFLQNNQPLFKLFMMEDDHAARTDAERMYRANLLASRQSNADLLRLPSPIEQAIEQHRRPSRTEANNPII